MIRVTFSKPDGIFRRMFSGAHSLRDRWVECIILVAFDKQYGFWAHYNFLGQIFCWFVFLTIFSKWLWKCVYWIFFFSDIGAIHCSLCCASREFFVIQVMVVEGNRCRCLYGSAWQQLKYFNSMHGFYTCRIYLLNVIILFSFSVYTYVSPFWIAFLSGQVLQVWTKS
jgi:hypothetical protein